MAQPIEVVHVIDSLAAGGAERVLVELVNRLTAHGVCTGVVVTRQGLQLAPELDANIPLLVLGRTTTWDLRAVARFNGYCRRHRVKIVHAHGRSSLNFCALAKVLGGSAHSIVFHDHFGLIAIDKQVPRSLRLTSRYVDHYIGVDPALRAWCIDRLGIAPQRASVLENAIDLARFDGIEPLPRRKLADISQPLVGALLANLRPQKNHETLFEAMAQSKLARQQLHVLLVGHDLNDDYSRHCHSLVARLGLQDNISFLGSRSDVARILGAVDFGLLCSGSESGPVALLEYGASQLPFVATSTGQIAAALQQAGVGIFAAPGNPLDYAAALDSLISQSAPQRRQAGLRARQVVAELFDLGQQVRLLQTIYQDLVKR